MSNLDSCYEHLDLSYIVAFMSNVTLVNMYNLACVVFDNSSKASLPRISLRGTIKVEFEVEGRGER